MIFLQKHNHAVYFIIQPPYSIVYILWILVKRPVFCLTQQFRQRRLFAGGKGGGEYCGLGWNWGKQETVVEETAEQRGPLFR
jgi:hypothetical protein